MLIIMYSTIHRLRPLKCTQYMYNMYYECIEINKYIKGTFGVYTRSIENIYLSQVHTGSCGNLFHKIPSNWEDLFSFEYIYIYFFFGGGG